MAIIDTVTFHTFERAFKVANRSDYFSYEGKRILFDFLEELSEISNEDIELDIIDLCGTYEECSLEYIVEQYEELDLIIDDKLELYPNEADVMNALSLKTRVCGSYYCEEQDTTVFVFQSF